MNRHRSRTTFNSVARVAVIVASAVALLPLSLVLFYTVARGLPAFGSLDFFLNAERPVGVPGAGVGHAIAGTLVMVGLASVAAVPVGVLCAIFLREYGHGRVAAAVRTANDVLVATPSIVIGLFAYALIVAPLRHFSALSASFALAVLMLPVVARTAEGALTLVPESLREAGLALGLPRWRVALQLVLPAAAPGVITGALLAIARGAGETAPLLFTGFGNTFWNLDPRGPMSALPLIVFHDALTPYPSLQQVAWGAALVLVLMVLMTNLLSRFALRRQLQLAGRNS
ncbi:MAG: phosphate ABC transporter permease PstA [Candidatus Dormibacteria bacterium]